MGMNLMVMSMGITMMFKRLPFKLPEWSPRITWSSAGARETWQPRIQAVSQAWVVVERDSVAAGIRPSALQHVSSEELPALMKTEAARGLIVLPLAQVAKTGAYQSASVTLQPGAPFDYKCAITQFAQAAAWATAYEANDDDVIGQLLGTPECCRRAFKRFWVDEHWMDLTVPCAPWAPPTNAPTTSQDALQSTNGLLRWLGQGRVLPAL